MKAKKGENPVELAAVIQQVYHSSFLFVSPNIQVGITKTEFDDKNKAKVDEKADGIEDDPWAGLSYTIDDETGTVA